MRKTLYTPFLTSTLFLVGTFVVFRVSPWQPKTIAHAQTRAHEEGYYEYDAETAKRFEEANQRARIKQGILSLADPDTASRLQMRPEVQRKAEEVVNSLQKRTEARLDEVFAEWRQEKGDRRVGAPHFMAPSSRIAHELDDWKVRAEQEVFDILTPKEQQQWANHAQSSPSKKRPMVVYAE